MLPFRIPHQIKSQMFDGNYRFELRKLHWIILWDDEAIQTTRPNDRGYTVKSQIQLLVGLCWHFWTGPRLVPLESFGVLILRCINFLYEWLCYKTNDCINVCNWVQYKYHAILRCNHDRSQTLKSDEAKWSNLTRITLVGSFFRGKTHDFEKIRRGDGLVCLYSSSPRELWYDPKQIATKMILVVKQSS